MEWKRILFSDERINRMGCDGKTYIRRRPCQEFNPKYTKAIVKQGGDNIKFGDVSLGEILAR